MYEITEGPHLHNADLGGISKRWRRLRDSGVQVVRLKPHVLSKVSWPAYKGRTWPRGRTRARSPSLCPLCTWRARRFFRLWDGRIQLMTASTITKYHKHCTYGLQLFRTKKRILLIMFIAIIKLMMVQILIMIISKCRILRPHLVNTNEAHCFKQVVCFWKLQCGVSSPKKCIEQLSFSSNNQSYFTEKVFDETVNAEENYVFDP